ncbi:hypothetical protein F8M41_014374 [Gigaspora margarita]|uniref:Uncharacterized protein n=1 Tax=Gigaspora margarita TaxID=4874 RepID=A0A8H3WVF4_GIGMA|nr:hypothetical protein F8M41_014374 [Gigaspora margarita]
MIKILEDKLTLAQKDAFSIQEDSSKKILRSGLSSLNCKTSKNLSQYFAHRKIIYEVKKISTDILTYTNDKIVPILESSKINTGITSKVSDKTIINNNSKDNKDNKLQPIDTENQFQEIKNVILIKSHNITIGRSKELPIRALGASMANFLSNQKGRKFYPVYRKESYGFPICHAKKFKNTSYKTIPYRYERS